MTPISNMFIARSESIRQPSGIPIGELNTREVFVVHDDCTLVAFNSGTETSRPTDGAVVR